MPISGARPIAPSSEAEPTRKATEMAHRLDLLYWHGYRRLAHLPDAQLCWAAFYPALVCLAFAGAAVVPIGGLLWLAT